MFTPLQRTTFMEMVTFAVPPPEPPAYVQTVDAQKSDTSALNFKSYYQGSGNMSDQVFLKKAASYIEKNEHRVHTPYKDIYGKWTVGVGHLMSPEEVRKYVGKRLSDQEVQALFEKDLNEKLNLARRMFGSVFNSYSDNLKVAILDGFFRGDLSGSPKTINLLKAKRFQEAAKEYLNNAEYRKSLNSKNMRGVAHRMQRNAKIMAAEK